jgi:hemerythrin superfamily protein
MASATALLREDHRRVRQLFEAFVRASSRQDRQRIARQAIRELEVHAALEEELFYPAVREAAQLEELLREATDEHQAAHLLMHELKRMTPIDQHFAAKFAVLMESVTRHMDEEESEMLPKAEQAPLDLEQLGQEMAARKTQLLASRATTARGASRRNRVSGVIKPHQAQNGHRIAPMP